jgi:hypothetical protein
MMRKGSWMAITALAWLVGVYALVGIAVPGLRSPFLADLISARSLRTVGHLGAGGVAIVAGAFQFSARLRFESPRVHRRLGYAYVIAVLVSGLAGGLLAPWSSGGVAAHFGFGMLAVLWVTSAVVAWRRAARGAYAEHRAWMIRSYGLCLAAVTLRVYLPISAVFGVPFEAAYPAIAWLCWVPNLVVAEWLVVPSSVAPLEPEGEPTLHAA